MCCRYHVPEKLRNSSQGLVAENIQNSFVWNGVLCFKKSIGNNLDPNPYLQHLWSMERYMAGEKKDSTSSFY